ncbi:MAG: PilZ domain-containing protein [Candidatus Omnitrophica bacterium]|nr:PilZ domain-containing protein [Candidatus Omnitrophota bacterium]
MAKINVKVTEDNRKSERLSLPVAVFYSQPLGTWKQPRVLLNISGDGLGFKDDCLLKKKSQLNIKIDLADGERPIVCVGEVTWNKKLTEKKNYQTGVRLFGMNYEDRQRYVEYICEKILEVHLSKKGEVI